MSTSYCLSRIYSPGENLSLCTNGNNFKLWEDNRVFFQRFVGTCLQVMKRTLKNLVSWNLALFLKKFCWNLLTFKDFLVIMICQKFCFRSIVLETKIALDRFGFLAITFERIWSRLKPQQMSVLCQKSLKMKVKRLNNRWLKIIVPLERKK